MYKVKREKHRIATSPSSRSSAIFTEEDSLVRLTATLPSFLRPFLFPLLAGDRRSFRALSFLSATREIRAGT